MAANLSDLVATPVHETCDEKFGISVIVPSHMGSSRLIKCLSSLEQQSISREFFEVILVLNGPEDGSHKKVTEFIEIHKFNNVRIFSSSPEGAGRARNVGIALARFRFITFLDDDDALEPKFLERALEITDDKTVVLAEVVDQKPDGSSVGSSLIGKRVKALGDADPYLWSVPWALGYNGAKIFPSCVLKAITYPEDLKSGEDVVFNAQLLTFPQLRVRTISGKDQARYIRVIRNGSVSRQHDSIDFNVQQRIDCIHRLEALSLQPSVEDARRFLVRAQLGFIERFWNANPRQHESIRRTLARSSIRSIDWNHFPREDARIPGLVVSYCFPPYADTSASVMAKRIILAEQPVHVISANMSKVRGKDTSLLNLLAPWVEGHDELNVPVSFGHWEALQTFADAATAVVISSSTKFEKMYSRALWVGSHLASLKIKQAFPKIKWTAEFSDPMRFDAEGKRRESSLPGSGWGLELLDRIRNLELGFEIVSTFDLIEAATMLTADTLVFTNENQRLIMLEPYAPSLRQKLLAKSAISPHPIPSENMYRHFAPSKRLQADATQRLARIGYFGNFYPNRGLGSVLALLNDLPEELVANFELHVFTSDPTTAANEISGTCCVRVIFHPYFDYVEFLGALSWFDVLLVTDAETVGRFELNPFLPSKVADYMGSDAKVWAHVEPGSVLSHLDVDYKSQIADPDSVRTTVTQIVNMRLRGIE